MFTRHQALKLGYFYWLCIKNSDDLHTELSLGYLKDAKFYLESKASFIGINSIASLSARLLGAKRFISTERNLDSAKKVYEMLAARCFALHLRVLFIFRRCVCFS